MTAVLYFFVATVISYVASLQLGPVNIKVIQSAIQHNRAYALRVGIGGSLPEIVYAGLAFLMVEMINPAQFSRNWMHYITLPVFIFLAVSNFVKPCKELKTNTGEAIPPHHRGFFEGFTLAMLNPQLMTFWLLIIAFLKTKNLMMGATFAEKSMFVMGAAAGAFFLQLTFIALAGKYKEIIIQKAGKNFNKIIGSLFLLLAALDAAKLINNLT